MAHKTFSLEGIGDITVYKRKNNRSIRLTVEADGGVRVTLPLWVPYRAGLAFASARRSWIALQTQNHTATTILRNGQQVGKSHHLVFRYDAETAGVRTSVRTTEVVITCGKGYTSDMPKVQSAAKAACIRALRKQSTGLLLPRLRQLAASTEYPYRSGSIKQLKSRWGSCDQHANIVLNLYLIQLPWQLIDYVIFHELAHTRVLHHGPDFWTTLESLQPGARQLRKAMRLYRPALLVS